MEPPEMFDPGPPEMYEVTTLGDKFKRYIPAEQVVDPYYYSHTSSSPFAASSPYVYSPYSLTGWDHETYLKQKDSKKFNFEDITNSMANGVLKSICDRDPKDLSSENILKMVAAMKAKLMYSTLSISLNISHFECKMTPLVRETIVRAWKKLDMYGKKPPFVPRFDEYMNELPEKFNVEGGIIVKMIKPEDCGTELYFELQAILIDKAQIEILNDLTGSKEKTIKLGERKPLWRTEDVPFDEDLPF